MIITMPEWFSPCPGRSSPTQSVVTGAIRLMILIRTCCFMYTTLLTASPFLVSSMIAHEYCSKVAILFKYSYILRTIV